MAEAKKKKESKRRLGKEQLSSSTNITRMSIIDEKRALESNRNGTPNYNSPASRRYHDAPEVVVTDGSNPSSLPDIVQPELGAANEVPPTYSEHHDQLSFHPSGFNAGAAVTGKQPPSPFSITASLS